VVLLAYGAAQVSYDAHARLRADVDALQEAQALRELLQDALRSARAPQRPGDPRFTLHAGRLSFVTAGGGPPLDPDYDWLLTIEPGAHGLQLSATPVGRAPAAQVTIRAPGVTRLDVRARTPRMPSSARNLVSRASSGRRPNRCPAGSGGRSRAARGSLD